MAEELRLDATVVDRFSKPLGELRAKMQAVSRVGQAGTKSTSAEFNRFHATVEKVTHSIRHSLEPSLAAVGLEGLGAGIRLSGVAAAVAGVVASIRNFSSSTIELKALSKETGITVDFFQKLKAASSEFGVDASALPAIIQRVAENIRDIQRNKATALSSQLQFLPGGKELIETIKNASPDEAVAAELEFLSRVKEGVDRSRVADLFGLGEMSRFVQSGMKPFLDALAAKRPPPISDDDLRKSREYEASLSNMEEHVNKISRTIGGITIPWLTELIKGLEGAVETGEKLAETLMGKGSALEKLKAFEDDTGNPAIGKAVSGVGKLKSINETTGDLAKGIYGGTIRLLQEMLGIGGAKADEARPGQGKPGGPLPGQGLIKFRDEIKEGTKAGIIEGLRQALLNTATGAGIGGSTGRGFGGGATGGIGGGLGWGETGGGGGGRGGGGGGTSAGRAVMSAHRMAFGHPHRVRGGGATGGGGGGSVVGSATGSSAGSVYSMIERAAAGDKRIEGLMKAMFEGESNHTPGQYDIALRRGEASFGPFQLNKLRGLGVQIQKETGVDPADPATVQEQANFVADYIRRNRGPLTQWVGLPHGLRRIARGDIHPNDDQFARRVAQQSAEQPGALPSNVPRPGTGYRAMPGYENYGADAAQHRPGAALRAQAAASPFGLSGPVSGARTGKATLEVSLKGFPPVNTRSDGGSLFDKVELDRGRSMQQAK